MMTKESSPKQSNSEEELADQPRTHQQTKVAQGHLRASTRAKNYDNHALPPEPKQKQKHKL